ncbi:MAG: hypothetical protein H7235_07665, partial [Bdellovibrionaceae bacterium]|nr:hypothetical protein [Pseudobdellovibrionaceae bacterium]
MTIIYLLPHFDDEIFIIPKIRTDREHGHSQLFIFFMSSPLRAKESLRFLQKLGIATEKVLLMGDKFAANDGQLLNYFNEFYSAMISLTQIHNDDIEIVCPAFEGGHHDHDAISILGRALAKSWQCNLFEFYLYHGYGTQG